jgi:hypothetical protein
MKAMICIVAFSNKRMLGTMREKAFMSHFWKAEIKRYMVQKSNREIFAL